MTRAPDDKLPVSLVKHPHRSYHFYFGNVDTRRTTWNNREIITEDVCLQTLLLLFKCANHRNKRPFVSTANEALVGTYNDKK